MLKRIVLATLFLLLIAVVVHPPKIKADGGPLPMCPTTCPNACTLSGNTPHCTLNPPTAVTYTMVVDSAYTTCSNGTLRARWYDSAAGLYYYAQVIKAGGTCLSQGKLQGAKTCGFVDCCHWDTTIPMGQFTLGGDYQPKTAIWQVDRFAQGGGGHR
jgi:hypothetical protein